MEFYHFYLTFSCSIVLKMADRVTTGQGSRIDIETDSKDLAGG